MTKNVDGSVKPSSAWNFTSYMRDASGNVLNTITSNNGPSNLTDEFGIYGSSRLGTWNPNLPANYLDSLNAYGDEYRMAGDKAYELSNHLGNVIMVVNDKKLGYDNNSDGYANLYHADIISANDYYAFGMIMPGRAYSSPSYRYGFNGKEKDDEAKGSGNQQDYGFRIYDTRLGRFLSVDPLTKAYPSISPYPYAMNRPIDGVDIDGLEWIRYRGWTEDYDKGGVVAVFANATHNTFVAVPNAIAGLCMGTKDLAAYSYKVATGKRDIRKDLTTAYNQVKTSVSNFISQPPAKIAKDVVKTATSPEAYGTAVGIISMGGGIKSAESRTATTTTTIAEAESALFNTFSSGGTKLVSSAMLEAYETSMTYGDPIATFIAPTAEVDALLAQGLPRAEIASRLGITNKAFLKGDLIRVDIEASQLKGLNLRPTTGTEVGANNQFVAGGKTIGGISEGVVDGIPKNGTGITTTIIETGQ